MGDKVTVTDITTLDNSSTATAINTNFDTVADEFDLVIYRDGSLDMSGNLNMDSNRIINLGEAVDETDAISLGQSSDLMLELIADNPGPQGPAGSGGGVSAVSILDFPSVVADGVTDCYAGVQAAIDSFSVTGGWLHFPEGTYFFSDRLKVRRPMKITGERSGSLSVVPGGTLWKFAAGSGGIIFYGVSDSDESPATIKTSIDSFGVLSPYYTDIGALDSVIENITLQGQGGAAAIGVETRTRIRATHLYIRAFSSHGFKISASTNGLIGNYGNASDVRLTSVQCIGNSGDGFHTIGIDANSLMFIDCKAQINGGYGFYDRGFLGNNYFDCHVATNSLGAWYGDPAFRDNAYHTLFGCYTESGTGAKNNLGLLTDIIGGSSSAAGNNDTDNDAFCLSGGVLTRRHLTHDNLQGNERVKITLGFQDENQRVLTWGANEEGLNGWKWQYDEVNHCWNQTWANSKNTIQWSNNIDGAFRASAKGQGYGPAFPGGWYFGGLPSRKGHVNSGTAAPVAGDWGQGDIIFREAPIAGGFVGWICVASGTPGTWKTWGVISA